MLDAAAEQGPLGMIDPAEFAASRAGLTPTRRASVCSGLARQRRRFRGYHAPVALEVASEAGTLFQALATESNSAGRVVGKPSSEPTFARASFHPHYTGRRSARLPVWH